MATLTRNKRCMFYAIVSRFVRRATADRALGAGDPT
jgi:hypothetical protein